MIVGQFSAAFSNWPVYRLIVHTEGNCASFVGPTVDGYSLLAIKVLNMQRILGALTAAKLSLLDCECVTRFVQRTLISSVLFDSES